VYFDTTGGPVQILHPFAGSIQQYSVQVSDVCRYRPLRCPLCHAKCPLVAHGFYRRTLVDLDFDGLIRIRRYLCRFCCRTVSLLPEFALPYSRFSVTVISRFLLARLLHGRSLKSSAEAAGQPGMPYQRGQFWIRRFRLQAAALCAALAALTAPVSTDSFVSRALGMLVGTGWIPAHRFLFSEVRAHLLGWPRFLAPDGRPARFRQAQARTAAPPHTICMEGKPRRD
jgi:hypothetical protein